VRIRILKHLKSISPQLKLPYLLLADADPDRRDSFIAVFENHVAYATVSIVDDGQSLLSFLAGCGWKDLPSLIILNYQLPDMTAPNILRELLTDPRYLSIPKLIWIPTSEKKEIEECRILGVKHFLKFPVDKFEFESEVRIFDGLLKTELNLL
jgi:CheY-like chemotaxis protein